MLTVYFCDYSDGNVHVSNGMVTGGLFQTLYKFQGLIELFKFQGLNVYFSHMIRVRENHTATTLFKYIFAIVVLQMVGIGSLGYFSLFLCPTPMGSGRDGWQAALPPIFGEAESQTQICDTLLGGGVYQLEKHTRKKTQPQNSYLSMSLSRRPLRSGRRQVQISSVTVSIFCVIMLTTSATTCKQQHTSTK